MATETTTTADDNGLPNGTTESSDLGGAGGDGVDLSGTGHALESVTDPEQLRAQILRERSRHAGEAKRSQGLQQQLDSERQTRARMEGELNVRRQQPSQTETRPEPQQPILSAAEARQLSDAQLAGDWETYSRLEDLRANRIAERSSRQTMGVIQNAAQQAQVQNTANAAIGNYLKSAGVTDMNSPVAKLAGERLEAMKTDPNYAFLGSNVAAATALAVQEARAELGGKEADLRYRGGAGHEFTESSSAPARGTPGSGSTKAFNAQIHLSQAERAYVDERKAAGENIDYKTAWGRLEKIAPGMQKARLESGRALTTKQLKSGVR